MNSARARRIAFLNPNSQVSKAAGPARSNRRGKRWSSIFTKRHRRATDRRPGMESLERREMFALASPPDELFDLATGAVAVQLGFIDDDSRNDMVMLEASGDLSVALNNGDDTWRQVKVSNLNIVGAAGLTLARINDDPFLDAIVQGANEVVIALADGEGGFTRSQSLTPAAAGELTVTGSPVGVLATMLNGDMLTDLAVVVPDTDEVLVYLGQASGNFGSPVRYGSGADSPRQLVAGDFVGNAAADLAVAHADGTLTFFRGDASGAFVLQTASTVTGLGSVTGLTTADIDEDGQTDLVVSSAANVRVLINPDDSLPTSPVVNGDFQLGLFGWTVAGGNVTAADGAAQVRESTGQLLSTLEQTFVVPSGAQTLSFDLVELGLEIPTNGLADAFEVSLLGTNGQSLVPTFHPEATSFFNVGPGVAPSLASGVTQTGSRITVSLTGLTQGTQARLIFDLVGNPGGASSAVTVDNVSIVPEAAWGTAFSTINAPGPFSGVAGLTVVDVDNDGNVDLVVSDQAAGQIVVCHGDGSGGFTRWTYNLATFGTGAGAIAAAPLTTGDSLPDVVIALGGVTGVLTPLDYQPVVESDIFRVPGSPGELTELVFTWTVRDAGYNNELGFFIVDDLQARVDGLLPGDAGYIQAAIANPGRQVVFAASQTEGAVTRVTLPAGTLVTPYLVQNDSTGDLLRDNPTGVVTGSPLVWFLHGAANTDGHNHFIVEILPDGRVQYGVEDQTHNGDGDFNDMIFTLAAEPGEPLPTHRFSVVDDTSLATFRYDPDGLPAEQTGLAAGNTRPRDITTNLAADKYWVIDANKLVYVYSPAGDLLGSWQPTGLTTPTGIATNGTDIWIVDASNDRVRRYTGAASRLSGSQAAFSTFNLNSNNTNASGITTDGTKFWVTDEGNDRVYVYSSTGQSLGNWQLASANSDASGLTVNPAGGDDIWVVDRQDGKVYYYDGATAWTSGQHAATSTFNLAAANRKPEGIADPPTPINLDEVVSATISAANEIDEYTFTVAAGQLAYFDKISLSGVSWTTMSWKLLGPSGEIVFNWWSFDDRDTIELTSAGTYTLQVKGTQSGANYSFRVVNVPAPTTTPISLDATQSGTFTVQGQTKNHTFSANAGQRLYLDAITPTFVNSGMKWELKGPTGDVVVNEQSFADEDNLVLPSTGTYTLRTYSNVENLAYSFRVIDVPPISSTPIDVDVTYSAQLTKMGESDELTFTGAVGQRIFLNAITPTSAFSGVSWQLKSPTGAVVVSYRAYFDVDTFTLTESGTHTLLLHGTADNTNYSLQVVEVPPTETTPIEFNTTYFASIARPGESDEYTFTATAGQRLYFRDPPSTSPSWKLVGPSGTVFNWTAGAWEGEMPQTGLYTLMVDATGDAIPNYDFAVYEIAPTVVTPLVLGALVNGTISTPGEKDRYTFTATAGQQLQFDSILGNTFNMTWRLFSPTGTQVFPNDIYTDRGPLTLVAGQYTLELDGKDHLTPAYQFRVSEVAPPVIANIEIGQMVEDTIAAAGEVHQYRFSAEAGQHVFFDHHTGAFTAFDAKLDGPAGLVWTQTDMNDRDTFVLSLAGEYVLTVTPHIGVTGDFSFTLQDVPAPIPVSLVIGQTVVGSIGVPGEDDHYQFTGQTGDRLFLDILQNNGLYPRGFALYRSGGASVFSPTLTQLDKPLFTLPADDTYTLVVGNYNLLDSTGDYSFRLVSVPEDLTLPAQWHTNYSDFIVPGQTINYTFSATAGQGLLLDLTNPGAAPFKLLGPSSQTIFSGQSTDQWVDALPATGTYTLVIGGSANDKSGPIGLRLQDNAAPEIGVPDTMGTDFWVAFPSIGRGVWGSAMGSEQWLDITAEVATSGTVSIPGTDWYTSFSVVPGQTTRITLPHGTEIPLLGREVTDAVGVRITALNEVAVYAMNYMAASSDAVQAFPVDALGTEYLALGHPNTGFGFNAYLNSSHFAIVATTDNTTVTITPSVDTDPRLAGVPYNITLDRGQVYQLTNQDQSADLSGSIITADQPIAVFGGNGSTTVPTQTASANHLLEQLPAIETWGRRFLTVPLATRLAGDAFRILAGHDDTDVSINGTVVATLDRGEIYDTVLTAASEITATQGVLVVQISHSTNYDFVLNADPFYMLVPAVEQFQLQHVTTTPSTGFLDHYLNLVVPAAAVGTVELDGQAIASGSFSPIGTTGFSRAQILVSPGRHVVTSTHGIGVNAYGYGVQDGYGYIAGTSLAHISEVNSIDLTPVSTTVPVGSQHIVTATVLDGSSDPVAGVLVNFTVTGGSPISGSAVTNALGQAQFTITASAVGLSTITATALGLTDNASVTWSDSAPTIAVESPTSGSELIVGSSYLLTGRALPGTPLGTIVDVTVNGLGVEALDQSGRFFIRVPIALGTNNFTIVATRADGVTGTTGVSYVGVAAPAPGIDLDLLTDFTGVAGFTSSGTFYNRYTRELHSAVRITNHGDDPLRGPVVALVDRITPASVILPTTPDGLAADGRQQVIFDTEFSGTLAPGASTSGVWLTFDVPAEERFAIDVTLLTQANRAPTIGSVPQLEAVVGVEYSHAVSATDADGDSLTYVLLVAPEGMTISAGGLIQWTPLLAQAGSQQVEVEVSDPRGGAARQRFTIQARNNPDNRAPVFQSAPVAEVASGGNYVYQPVAFDLDGDSLTWSLDQSPGTMSINSTTGEITWTNATTGNHLITIEANDSNGGVAYQSFVLSAGIASTNLGAPILRSTPPTEAAVDVLYAHQVWADDPEGGTLYYSLIQKPTGMSIDAAGRITWTPTSGQTGPHTVELIVHDGAGGVASAIYTVNVFNPLVNRVPIFSSQPVLLATEDAPYQYQVAAADPEGQAVTLTLVSGHQDMDFDPATGLLTWTPAATGAQLVRLRAQDTGGATSWQTFLIDVRESNTAPWITSDPVTTATAGTVYRYDVEAADQHDGFTFSLVDPPAGMQIDSQTGLIWWQPATPAIGPHDMLVRVTDDRGAVREQSFTLTVTADITPPVVNIVRSEEAVNISQPVDLQVFANDNLGVSSVTLTINGSPVTLNGQNQATFTPTTSGFYNVVATATDAASNVGTASFRLRVIDPTDVTAPTVVLTSPSANSILTYLTDLVGTVSDTNLDFWRIEYARLDTDEFHLLAEGTTNVTASTIATFDPTVLQNDQYLVRITASDISGNTTTLERPLEVTGHAKLGRFRQEFTDLTIPLAGIPITITRIYDTLASHESGDFGYGWSLGVREAKIRETVRQNPLEPLAGLFATTSFREGTRVYLNAPDGRRIGFTFTPTVEGGFFGDLYHPKFTADPGVYETLTVEDMPLTKFPDGTFHLYFANFNYNPSEYTLTTKDQRVYRYDQFDGLLDVTDRNGNKLTYTENGIFHSSGESIEFVRDGQGRIIEIIDPAGNSLHYTYDGRGDLVTFRNQENLGTNFDYYDDPAHYLREVTSDCGCTSYFRTEYDDAGRVIAIYDALGNPAEMSYDLPNNTEIIGDREGNESILVYDDRGNITSITDPMGAVTTFTYNANNNQTSVTDGRGFTTTFSYDANGNETSKTDPYNNTWTFTYTARNDIASIVDPLGRTETFVYDTNANLTQYTDKDNKSVFIVPDSLGRTSSYTDRTGKTTTFTYGVGSQPTRITLPDSTYRQVQYNLLGLPILATDEEGRETAFSYDNVGLPLTILDAEGGIVTMVYVDQRLDRIIDRLGRVTQLEYDNNGRRTKVIDALGGTTSYDYDANGQVLAMTNALGHSTNYAYRDDGLLDFVTDTLGDVTRYQYDATKNQTAIVDANGHSTAFEYDKLNRLVKTTNALGGVRLRTYDALGNLTSERDENGDLTQYVYDVLNRRTQRIGALNNSAEWTYDAEGYVLTYTDETNYTTTYGYNSRYWLTSITDPAGKVQSFGYDDVGNRTSFTDEMLRTTAYAYDGLNRLTQITEPLSAITTYGYDAVGNRVSVIDPLLRETMYEYDDLNRLIKETDPRNAETSYTYDAGGNLKSLTDPVGNTTTFGYDALHRLVEEKDPFGRARTFEFDSVGNRTRRIDRNGRVIDYTFDELDRLTREQWRTADPNDTEFALIYTYDAVGNLLSAIDPNSAYAYTYDALDRVLTDSNAGTPGAPSVTLTSGYDAAGRRTSVVDNAGVTVSSIYDSRGLLERRTWSGGGIDPARLDFSYNDAGQRTQTKRFSDTTGTNQIGRTTFGYDAQGRLNDIVHRDTLDAVIADYDYLFDAVDQLTSSTHHGQTTTYTHDDAGQLTAADHSVQADEAYSYDLNGNRNSTGYAIGPNNQVLSDGTFDYTYDGEGNLLTKTDIATSQFTIYSYDHRNRLIAVHDFESTGEGLLQEVLFTYDIFDRRIAKSVDSDGEGPLAAVITHFVHDVDHVWADYSSAGAILARYLYGDRVDEILARYQPTTGTAWHLTDKLGTVRDLVDETGDLLNHIDYDTFGQIVVQTDAGAADRFTYTGREWDEESGLYYYRARYFDPQLGRFISLDPIGFDAGDSNLYRYVSNDPLGQTDPSGKAGEPIEYGQLAKRSQALAYHVYRQSLRRMMIEAQKQGALGQARELWQIYEWVADGMLGLRALPPLPPL